MSARAIPDQRNSVLIHTPMSWDNNNLLHTFRLFTRDVEHVIGIFSIIITLSIPVQIAATIVLHNHIYDHCGSRYIMDALCRQKNGRQREM